MELIEVMVRVFYLGRRREAIVEVAEEAFVKKCWRPIAALKAAVLMGIPFTDMDRLAKFGLRPEDKQRLLAACEETKEDKHE